MCAKDCTTWGAEPDLEQELAVTKETQWTDDVTDGTRAAPMNLNEAGRPPA